MNLISHPAENSYEEKKLVDHLSNVAEKCVYEIKNRKINFSIISKKRIIRLALLIGLFHDFGKATTWFQNYIRGNQKSSNYSNHSFISAIVCYCIVNEEFDENLAYLAFQVVLKHHTNLVSFDLSFKDFNYLMAKKQLENILENNFDTLKNFYQKYDVNLDVLKNFEFELFEEVVEDSDMIVDNICEMDDKAIEYFFLNNYLFSLLIDFDKLDAARLDNSYFAGNLQEPINEVFPYINECRMQNPEKFNPKKPINKLRNEFLLEIYKNDKINTENKFYSITAPTGIGKTFGCIVFANKLKKQLKNNCGRIIYCLPYTSIIDQNYKVFEDIIRFNKKDKYNSKPTRYLLKHHYQAPKKIKNRLKEKQESLKDYLDDQLLVESWQSSFIVTTFVQIFHSLIGYRNRFLKKFHNIVNSIIILDEVQNIDPNYYLLFQKTFGVLAKVFNIYFLQITATQPEILEKDKIVKLIDEKKYMQNKLINRVSLEIDLNERKPENFLNEFINDFRGKNCLIVVNTKKMAILLYDELNNYLNNDYFIFCLTTNLIPKDRNKQIKQIDNLLKNGEKLIVVSTQLIEAGVDLSFENVYRDLGPLDSIIQVAGRCNRNGEMGQLNGKMKLLNLSNNQIYKSILIQYVKEVIQNKYYKSAEFFKLTKIYFSKFNFSHESKKILRAIKELNYDKRTRDQIPISDFKLINDKQQENIYILTDKSAQTLMNKFLIMKEKLKNKLSKEEKDNCRLQIEKIKYKLIPYKISVYRSNLVNYQAYLQPEEEIQYNENYPYKFLSYDFQKKYAYDNKLGFLKEPKKQLNNYEIL